MDLLNSKTTRDSSLHTQDLLCNICKKKKPIYTCPKCKITTCSVLCVKQHKRKHSCNGIKDKYNIHCTNFQDYSEKDFFRDMKYLNDTVNDINRSNKIIYNITEETPEDQNSTEINEHHQRRNFKRIVKKFRNVRFHCSPKIMKRFRDNKSYCDSARHLFSNTQFDDEITRLSDIIDYFTAHKDEADPRLLGFTSENSWKDNVKFLYKMNSDSLDVFDRMKYIKHGKYYYKECNVNLSLKELLNGMDVYEYPEFYIQ